MMTQRELRSCDNFRLLCRTRRRRDTDAAPSMASAIRRLKNGHRTALDRSYMPSRAAATRSSSSSSNVRVVKERHRRLPPPPSHLRSQKQPEKTARSNAPAMATAATNVCVGSSDDDADVRKRRRANAYDDVLVAPTPSFI
jgi:hypothetical protein